MILNQAIKKIKNSNKKVKINLEINNSINEKLELISDNQNISKNELINSILELALSDENVNELKDGNQNTQTRKYWLFKCSPSRWFEIERDNYYVNMLLNEKNRNDVRFLYKDKNDGLFEENGESWLIGKNRKKHIDEMNEGDLGFIKVSTDSRKKSILEAKELGLKEIIKLEIGIYALVKVLKKPKPSEFENEKDRYRTRIKVIKSFYHNPIVVNSESDYKILEPIIDIMNTRSTTEEISENEFKAIFNYYAKSRGEEIS